MKNVIGCIIISVLFFIIINFLSKQKINEPLTAHFAEEVETKNPQNPQNPQNPKQPKTVKTLEAAIASAKSSDCDIFLYFGATWCGYCRQMKKVFEDKEVKHFMSKNFVILLIDTDLDPSLTKKFGINGIPKYMILNSNAKQLQQTDGFKPKKEFIKWLEVSLQEKATRTADKLPL